jgi:hypothetical protein
MDVTVEEDLRTVGGANRSSRVVRQICLDEDPEICPDECMFRGGDVNPKNI